MNSQQYETEIVDDVFIQRVYQILVSKIFYIKSLLVPAPTNKHLLIKTIYLNQAFNGYLTIFVKNIIHSRPKVSIFRRIFLRL